MGETTTSTLRALYESSRGLLLQPEDTEHGVRLANALAFGAYERLLARFRATPTGARLLREREDIVEVLSDRARLEAMPSGSLGRAYRAFVDAEQISARGLVSASARGGMSTATARGDCDDVAYLMRRMLDTHDLWHAVTGYRGDYLGELALMAFNVAQMHHPGFAFLTFLGGLMTAHQGAVRMIADGFRRGRRASWLVAVDWLPLLPQPLAEVRASLAIDPGLEYREVRELPAWLARRPRAT
jgi:ubiquinone biosynthesis protein COQ4